MYVRQADVLLGLHDESLYWAFFMRQHSSVVEIRPRGVAGPQADQHMKVHGGRSLVPAVVWGLCFVETQGRTRQKTLRKP